MTRRVSEGSRTNNVRSPWRKLKDGMYFLGAAQVWALELEAPPSARRPWKYARRARVVGWVLYVVRHRCAPRCAGPSRLRAREVLLEWWATELEYPRFVRQPEAYDRLSRALGWLLYVARHRHAPKDEGCVCCLPQLAPELEMLQEMGRLHSCFACGGPYGTPMKQVRGCPSCDWLDPYSRSAEEVSA